MRAHLHPIAREINPERGFRELRRHLLGRQLYLPRPVRVPVETQVFLVRIALRVEFLGVCRAIERGD